MALATLFAKSVDAGLDMGEGEEPEDPSVMRTRSSLAFASFATQADRQLDAMPSRQRQALEDARASTSLMLVSGKRLGPTHFCVTKLGTGLFFDVVLGNPCTVQDRSRPVDSGIALMLVYWVLVKVLHVQAGDPILKAAPHFTEPMVERLFASAAATRARAVRSDADSQRVSYEQDQAVERGESAINFAQFLGEAPLPPPGPRARGGGTVRDPNGSMRMHPRNAHFGGLPPMDLGGGNAAAASGSRGSAMLSIDSLPQLEALQQATWRRRRRPRASEAFGQTALPPGGAAAAMHGGVADQYWEAARAHSGPVVYPWRRELHLSEQVAFLSKRGTSLDPNPHGSLSEGSTKTSAAGAHPSSAPLAKTTSSPDAFAPEASMYSPLRPSKKNLQSTQPSFGDCNQPGLDASGNASTRLATLPDFPFNSSGGRVAVSSAIVLPAGMGIRHPASFAASKYAGQVCEYLALWRNCADPQAKKALGDRVDELWMRHFCFRAWAKNVYGLNRRRAEHFRQHPMRITVFADNGAPTQLKISPIATGLDLKRAVDAKKASHGGDRALTSSNTMKKAKGRSTTSTSFVGGKCVLLFEGVPVDDRVSLRDAGVRPRSTLTLTRVPAQMMRGDDGLPVY